MAQRRWSTECSGYGTTFVPSIATVQGKPVVRRGRKARDLPCEDRPAAGNDRASAEPEVVIVKANLARFTVALSLLATMAMTLGAGIKWH